MAHQPKAYKKFVASAATATLVATAIVPVASAATDFKDVSKTYEKEVNYLVENGIAKGTTETTFGTNSNISRGDAAVMIANALKLDTAKAPDAGFQDVNARVAGAVNAIVEAKIASGKTATSFDPAAYITRQEMAKMLANAYKLTAKENANFKDVNSNWIGYVSALKEAGITLGKTETTFAPTANLTRGEFALFIYRAEVELVPAPPATPEVVSVSATNLKTLTVEFNQPVDEKTITGSTVKVFEGTNTTATAVDTDNDFSSGVRYILSDDNKTLTVEFFSPNTQSKNIKVVVDGVKSVDGKDVTKYETTKTVIDTAVPVLNNAVSLNKKQIELQFSEPVNFSKGAFEVLNNIKIDGVAVIAKVVPNHADNKLILEFPSNLKVGTLKLEVSDISDFAGFKIASKEFDVTVAEDVSAPEITNVEVINKNKIRVTFNEKVATVGQFEVNDEAISGGNVVEVARSNGTKFDLTLTTALNLGAVVEAKVEYKGQKDVAENEVKEWKTYTFKVSDDTSLPTVTSALGTANKLTLTFNKSMKTNVGTIKVFDEDDKEVASLNVSSGLFKANSDAKVIELTGAQLGLNDVDAGKYTVKIKDMKDNTIRENLLPEQTLTIDAQDTKKPVVTTSYLVTNGTLTGSDLGKDDTVTFYFNEAMDETSVKNLSNYTIGGASFASKSGVSVKSFAADGKSVTITYPQARTLTLGASPIILHALKDKAGNMIENGSATANRLASTALAYTSVEASKKNEVTVEFNTNIASADPSAISIEKQNPTTSAWEAYTVPVGAVVTSNPKKVKFTLNKEIGTDATSYRIVDNNSQLVKNVYGDTFKVVDGVANGSDVIGAQVITDKIAPELKEVKAGNTIDGNDTVEKNQFTVVFSEKIKTAAVANADDIANLLTDLVIKDADGTLLTASDFTVVDTNQATGLIDGSSAVVLQVSNLDAGNNTLSIAIPAPRHITDLATSANTVKEAAAINVTVSVVGASSAPSYTVNNAAETTAQTVPATVEYSTDNWVTKSVGTGVAVGLAPASTTKFRVAAKDGVPASAEQTITIAARPAAPSGAISAATDDITGLTASTVYEVETATGVWTTFTADADGKILKATHGKDFNAGDTVKVRVKATSTAYKSAEQTITVGA